MASLMALLKLAIGFQVLTPASAIVVLSGRGQRVTSLAGDLVHEGALSSRNSFIETDAEQGWMKCPNHGHWEDATCESIGWQRAKRRRKVYEGFCYNGEIDMFWARRRELRDVIDGTSIIITKKNFKGKWRKIPKKPSASKMKTMLLPGWAFDRCQRMYMGFDSKCALSIAKNAVARAVEAWNPEPEDLVLFGDPDEIPNREFVRLLKECEPPIGWPHYQKEVIHMQAISHFMYDLQCKIKSSVWLWRNNPKTPVVVKVKTMKKWGLRVHQDYTRHCRKVGVYASCTSKLTRERSVFVPCACWHLSSFGGVWRIKHKIKDNANNSRAISYEDLRQCKENNKDRWLGVQRLTHPATRYPEVPHSIADDLTRFKMFLNSWRR